MAIEREYKILTDREHIVSRPQMYIGGISIERSSRFVMEEGKFVLKEIDYNPGFIKIFDEILDNSVDESKRKDSKLDTIKISVDRKSGMITVWDNGGMPVHKDKTSKIYVPEMCMGYSKAGSNFNDNEKRETVGTHGIGAYATNCMSTRFYVETADGSKKFYQVYANNAKDRTTPKITVCTKHYTQISYIPDYEKFGMEEISDDIYKSIESRVYEVAGTNPKLKIYFNDKKIDIKSFKDYCLMFLDSADNFMYEETKDGKWSVGISTSNNGFQCISFVNSVNTFQSGTHVDYILNQFIPFMREKLNKKYKTDILPGQIRNHIMLFVNSTVSNPSFSSQTKERLVSDSKQFVNPIELSKGFLNNIYSSEITNLIADWLDQKKVADDKKAERDANKALSKVKVEKLIDAKWAGTSKKNLTSLAITEGLSASAGFRKFRNANTQALFPIRGKILNVRVTTNDKNRSNDELKGIMAAMGLQFGKSPFVYSNGKIIQDNLRIHEVHILTDADTDGDDIAGLLLNIFSYYWPELIKEHRIARIETPILIAKCGKKSEKFYHKSEFDEWCMKNDIKKWNIEYYKGLGSLEDCDYKDIIQNPNVYYYEWDDLANEELDIWFGKAADKRKYKLS